MGIANRTENTMIERVRFFRSFCRSSRRSCRSSWNFPPFRTGVATVALGVAGDWTWKSPTKNGSDCSNRAGPRPTGFPTGKPSSRQVGCLGSTGWHAATTGRACFSTTKVCAGFTPGMAKPPNRSPAACTRSHFIRRRRACGSVCDSIVLQSSLTTVTRSRNAVASCASWPRKSSPRVSPNRRRPESHRARRSTGRTSADSQPRWTRSWPIPERRS